jgi:hypothetical protein
MTLALAPAGIPQSPEVTPQTQAERSDFSETSSLAAVEKFLAGLRDLPHADRIEVGTCGRSHEGRPLLVVRAALQDTKAEGALRLLVIANIHAGEVEGKEAVQVLLREIASGQHEPLLEGCVVWFLPIYNVDGNEQLDRHRTQQNGPVLVGQRPNGQGLDLNRDCVKAEAPETQALLQLFRTHDPHVFLDLHTTDGSWHGYHLTYAPSLSTNIDPAIDRTGRALLETASQDLNRADPSYQTFDYGNFATRDWDGGGAPASAPTDRAWWTYDHRPRYGVNYYGLRNRIGILSEAYSNCDFATRIDVTRAFVMAIWRAAQAQRDSLIAACRQADRRLQQNTGGIYHGFDSHFGAPEFMDVLVGDCDRVPEEGGRGVRFVRRDVQTAERMPVYRRFVSRSQVALPAAWVLPEPPQAVLDLLVRHGIDHLQIASAQTVGTERFAVTGRRKPKRPFQGHQELHLAGSWQQTETTTLPAGTLVVASRQRLGRLAAQLLEPLSEDSLSTWNFLEAQTAEFFPVQRVTSQAAANQLTDLRSPR